MPITFKLKQVGAVMTELGQDMSKIGTYYGDSAMVYDNVFITLKKTTSLSSNLKTLRVYRLSHFKAPLNITHCGWIQ
ncbi:MAG: hypothetical protein ACJAWS_001925 [Oleiphilaceae bacterium]